MYFRDLNAQYRALKTDIDRAIESVIERSEFILGKEVSCLEEKLAEYTTRRYCVSCANGTDALSLILMAYGIGQGDAVFVPDLTFFATVNAVMRTGAFPVLVDVDRKTFNMSSLSLEQAIEKTLAERTVTPVAVLTVDLFGLCAPYDEIERICAKYGLKLFEDAAQGFGAQIGQRRACSFGDASATSFFPAKPLGCYGDGGAVFTDDDQIACKLRSLRAQGRSENDKYDNLTIGLNSRLDTIQAAILLPKFKAFVEHELDSVNAVAENYTAELSAVLKTPEIPSTYISSYAQYTVLTESSEERSRLRAYLSDRGIPTGVYYPKGMHEQTAVKKYGCNSDVFPNTEYITSRCLSLPIHPYMKDDDINKVIRAVKKFFDVR